MLVTELSPGNASVNEQMQLALGQSSGGGGGALALCTVENWRLTFDFPKTLACC